LQIANLQDLIKKGVPAGSFLVEGLFSPRFRSFFDVRPDGAGKEKKEYLMASNVRHLLEEDFQEGRYSKKAGYGTILFFKYFFTKKRVGQGMK
jgi:hypothetical protein